MSGKTGKVTNGNHSADHISAAGFLFPTRLR